MSDTIASLLKRLTPDPWRAAEGFSPDLESANNLLFSSDVTESQAIGVLREWLQENQPCLFGRIAAKLGFIRYCILKESDLLLSDEVIQEKIQRARIQWTKDAYEGKTSNFIILARSPAISYAVPDKVVSGIAQKLCSL